MIDKNLRQEDKNMNRKLCYLFIATVLLLSGLNGAYAEEWIPLNGVQTVPEAPTVELLHSDQQVIELNFQISGFNLQTVETETGFFDMISLAGEGYTTEIGQPQLPVIRRMVEIPYGAELTLVTGATTMRQDHAGAFSISNRIMPVQPPVEKTPGAVQAQQFTLDEEAYGESSFYIGEFARMGEVNHLRGRRFVMLEVFPFDYNPAEETLRIVNNITINVQLAGADLGLTRQIRARYADPQFDRLSDRLFVNSGSLDDPDLIPPPLGLLIITNQHYASLPIVNEFVEWKENKGYHTTVATTQQIGSTTNQIQTYIQNAYNTWPIPPNFVLLIGDTDVIPHWVGTGGSSPATDLYYATLEGGDLFADVGIGRFSPSNDGNLANMINKTLEYEQVGWTGNDTWEKYAVFMASNDNWGVSEGTHEYVINNYLLPDGYSVDRLYSHSYSATTQQVTNSINAGRSLAIYSGHGSVTSWADGPPFSQANVQALVNEVYPLVCSHACLTGQFSSGECFGETWLRVEHGALAFWAASVSSYWGEDDILEKRMFEGFFDVQWAQEDQNLTWISGMTDYAKVEMWQYYGGGGLSHRYMEMYNILGDPSVDIWTDVPQILSVNFPGAVLIGESSITVTVSGYPDWAMVNVFSDTEDLQFTGYVTNGTVTFDLGTGFTVPGNLHVWVTGHDCHPFHGTASIIPPSGPYVIFESLVIDDSVLGNNNGQLDYAETTEMSIFVENVGISTATGVTLTITSLDPLLTVIDGTEYLGDLPAGGIAGTNNGFTVEASSELPDEYALLCELSASDGVTQWVTNFSIPGHAPVVEFDALVIHDETGNQNGNLDPGETADLDVSLINNGSSLVDNVSLTASCFDPYITITSASANVGSLAPGGSAFGTISVEVSSSCPQEHRVTFNLDITGSNGYATTDEFSTVVGNILYAPTGPDVYGYTAYDPFDAPETPQYDWVEICADSGGPGTLVNFTQDDQTFQYDLPFNFGYYGQAYTRYTIAANGWVGMGDILEDDYSNSGIPDGDGPPSMIAPYWEDLSPQRTNSGKVWYWYDETDHRLIVEYNHIEQYAPAGAFETFQVILLDPVHYPTATNDGRILFQYKDMSGSVQSEGTVGIENQNQTIGLQVLFDGAYDQYMHPIENEMAILFSTPTSGPDLVVTMTPFNPPIQIPATGGSFDYNIEVANNGASSTQVDVWCDVTLPNGSSFGPTLGPANVLLSAGFLGDRDRTQNVPASAPSGTYTYNGYVGTYPSTVFAEDNFTFEKLITGDGASVDEWYNSGEPFEEWFQTTTAEVIPDAYSLEQNYPNPFNPATVISYKLPDASRVHLSVYDVNGRLVADLINGWRDAGAHQVTFDGSDLPSGVYFAKLQAGDFNHTQKIILLK
ncbi:hypothetical protein CEE37_13330 [candidate division LCP-89 bacterium B3_LCP]|uniref:Gingipain R n=1 Tax=candidate division LCP-89 bacterium B3_LCP TaxID=2012998 RepID=A0A532USN9_UNCL8|nr:MAG: hypothetical protein CEE37_13330 [candidate division LCP-89 bacterium B3_LCP]